MCQHGIGLLIGPEQISYIAACSFLGIKKELSYMFQGHKEMALDWSHNKKEITFHLYFTIWLISRLVHPMFMSSCFLAVSLVLWCVLFVINKLFDDSNKITLLNTNTNKINSIQFISHYCYKCCSNIVYTWKKNPRASQFSYHTSQLVLIVFLIFYFWLFLLCFQCRLRVNLTYNHHSMEVLIWVY